MGIKFDPTVSLGTIIVILSFVASVLVGVVKLQNYFYKLHAGILAEVHEISKSLATMNVKIDTLWTRYLNSDGD